MGPPTSRQHELTHKHSERRGLGIHGHDPQHTYMTATDMDIPGINLVCTITLQVDADAIITILQVGSGG